VVRDEVRETGEAGAADGSVHGGPVGRAAVCPASRRAADGLELPAVAVDEREVLVAEQAVQRLGQRHRVELRGHVAVGAHLPADLRAGLARDLVQHLRDGTFVRWTVSASLSYWMTRSSARADARDGEDQAASADARAHRIAA
jgi:hypothetical protein